MSSSIRPWARHGVIALTFAGAVALAAGGNTACSKADGVSGRDDSITELDKADWLEKTAQLLRNGEGLGPRDDVDALQAMPKEAVVDRFMQDPRFGDMVLAFNLYYLGRSVERVKMPSFLGGVVYDQAAFNWPQALASAKAVIDGGNYFELFSATPALIHATRATDRPKPGTFGGDPAGQRLDRAQILALFDKARSVTASDPEQGCALHSNARQQVAVTYGFAVAQALSRWLVPSTPAFPSTVDCNGSRPLDGARLAASMDVFRKGAEEILTAADAKPLPETIQSLADLGTIRSSVEGMPRFVEPLQSAGFWRGLPTTATNFQRKRAAYVLKTYFCDDLTPVNVPATADSGVAGDKHASNPNCQACHYRLDPIGALFRNYGSSGFDSSAFKQIQFDTGSLQGADFDKYLSEWRNPDGTFRAGRYVIGPDGTPTRDTTWLDSDGDTVEGLWSYLPRSETAKACLVRRLAEYVLGPKQVYDRDWLRELMRTSRFKNGPQSGAGFKNLVKSLVLSKTFTTQDPKAGVCYDAPSNAPANRPPCAVAHIVANQCADCHGSVQARGRIDLTTWSQLPDGTFSWPHLDEAGKQLSRTESLRKILDRLTTADAEKRMPFQRALESEEQNTFKTWLDENLRQTP